MPVFHRMIVLEMVHIALETDYLAFVYRCLAVNRAHFQNDLNRIAVENS